MAEGASLQLSFLPLTTYHRSSHRFKTSYYVQFPQTLAPKFLKSDSILKTPTMENHSLASHPDSRHSSPNSQEVDYDNPTMDDPLSTTTTNNSHKVKFMCSYGGNIQFRTHDNQLAYVGGDTKIITVDRSIKFLAMMAKLSSLCNADVFVKYQLPGEDLDSLISVTNDEDLEHMMVEYDLSQRASVKPARLRLFLFPPKPSAPTSFESNVLKPEQQWFVDALNSVHIPHVKGSSTSAPISASNPDFLSGLDYRYSVVSAAKLPDSVTPAASTIPHVEASGSPTGTDGGSEDRHIAGEPAGSPTKTQIQIEESQNLHLEKNERILPKGDEDNGTVNKTMDHYFQKNPKKEETLPAHIVPAPVSMRGSAAVDSPERLMASASYSLPASATVTEQPLYLIATPAVMYHATTLRAVTGPLGQPYYRVSRMVPTSEFSNGAPLASLSLSHSHSLSRIGAKGVETSAIVQPKVEVAEPAGYPQMVYEDAGRQIFIAAPATWGGVVPPHREVAAASDGTQGGGGTLNQEGKVSKAASAV